MNSSSIRKIIVWPIAVFILCYLSGCSSSKSEKESPVYQINKPKTTLKLFNVDSTYSVTVPGDWFATRDDGVINSDLLLLNESYDYAVHIKEIFFNRGDENLNENEALQIAAKLSRGLLQRKTGAPIKNIFPIAGKNLADRKYYDYEIGFGREQIGRVVVYKIKNRFFEIFAYSKGESITYANCQMELFPIQQLILNSFRLYK